MVIDIKRNISKVVDAASDKAKEFGESAADVAIEGIKIAGQHAQRTQQEIKRKIYNPLFPEEYWAENFDCPKMVVIEDEDNRKGIDVCDGAIGWLSKAAGSEVLHLYEEFVPESGLIFFPFASCESIYYRNPNKDNRFINLSCYFETMQQDKMTELKNIAYCLGAKECRLESYESAKEAKIAKTKHKGKGKACIPTEAGTVRVSAETELSGELNKTKAQERYVLFSQKFEGSDTPVEPTLDWYENDKEILSLIEMRLNGESVNQTKEYSVSIDSKLSLSMDVNLAAKLDRALDKLGVESNFTLKGESLKETRTKLEFVIVF